MGASPPTIADPAEAEPGVSGLALGEQLVLWAVRRRLENERHLPMIRRGFLLAGPGRHEHDAFTAFERFYAAVSGGCRRDLWFHRCGCGCVGEDELAILGLIAAAQAGDLAGAWSGAQSLVVAAAQDELLQAAAEFGQALSERRLLLPLRRNLSTHRLPAGARLH